MYGYVLACVFLILVILLQSGKGGDVAAAFGGAGNQTAFGPRGAQKPLEKATIVAAILFMVLALLFSLPGVIGGSSVVGGFARTDAQPAAPATAATASPAASVAASPSASAAASPLQVPRSGEKRRRQEISAKLPLRLHLRSRND
ncbi:MAG: preprotein translocase subunit SecG [Blastocatellia bacterium]